MEWDDSIRYNDGAEILSKSIEIILPEHEIFDFYYDLKKNLTNFKIAQTHQSRHRNIESSAKNIIKYLTADGVKYDYLVANEYEKGRVVFWAAGHTIAITEDEKKLFVNLVAWLTKYNKK